MNPSSLPIVATSFAPLIFKIVGGSLGSLLILLLGFLGRKKIYQMLGQEQQTILDTKLATNEAKESKAIDNVIALTQKKQDIQQQIKDVQVTSNPSDAQLIDFFTAQQVQLNDTKTK